MQSDPAAVDALETNLWSMFRILGSGPGGATTDTPDRLIVESPLLQPPYNSVLRFRDEGDRPLQLQVTEIWGGFRARGVTGAFVVHPTSPRLKSGPSRTESISNVGQGPWRKGRLPMNL